MNRRSTDGTRASVGESLGIRLTIGAFSLDIGAIVNRQL